MRCLRPALKPDLGARPRRSRRWPALLLAALAALPSRAADAPFVRVDAERGSVRIACRVAKQRVYEVLEGRIEFLLTGIGGKSYESLLVTEADPRAVHAALRSLGVPAGRPAREEDGRELLPVGGRLRIRLEREGDESRPIEYFLLDLERNEPLHAAAWVFTGSRVSRDPETGTEGIEAAVTGNLIALHHRDPTVLIQNAQALARDFRRFRPHPDRLPPEQAAVTLVIERDPLARRRFLVRGQVQGVGFRAFVERTARQNGVGGWVRNLPDGAVESVAEADPEALARFEAALARGPRGATVTGVESLPADSDEPLPAVMEVRPTPANE